MLRAYTRKLAAAQPALRLTQTEFLAVAIEYQLLTRGEPNFQHGSPAFMCGLGNTVNERVAFEYSPPYGREIVSLPH